MESGTPFGKMQVRILSMKKLFTTGQAATICNISQQTIIRCFDSGKLEGFKIPGSKFRRIPYENLLRFMKDNGIPLDNIEADKKKILLVDDDPEIIELLYDVLSRDARFEITTASTGYEAGMATQQFKPDLIILDYMLPDVNGNVVCKAVKSNPDFKDTKVIIVSGVINPEEIDGLLEAGAEKFINKPFSVTELVSTVSELLKLA